MALVTCPACRGRTPSSAVACMHCGHLAERCPDCAGSGVCPACNSEEIAGLLPCVKCQGTGRCPACNGNRVRWPTARHESGKDGEKLP